MKRIWLVALSGALATATMAFAVDDASAYRRAAGVRAVAYGGIATRGVYRRAYRRAAYGVGAYGLGAYGVAARPAAVAGWNDESYWGLGARPVRAAVAVGTAAGLGYGSNNYGYNNGYGSSYAAATPGNTGYDSYATTGTFDGGVYRRNLDMYPPEWRARVARGLARRGISPEAMTAWVNYPTRGEYIRGYVPPGYYGPQCHPWINVTCQ